MSNLGPMSNLGRWLVTLGLLSLGVILSLWGLRRKRSVAVLVLCLCLAALVPVALAQIEIPPAGSVAQLQTNGPNHLLTSGDWYASAGPGYHSFEIYIPCTIAPMQVITVELFDPESNDTGAGDLDEISGAQDNTAFTLTNPSGVVMAATTYTPTGGTSANWVISLPLLQAPVAVESTD